MVKVEEVEEGAVVKVEEHRGVEVKEAEEVGKVREDEANQSSLEVREFVNHLFLFKEQLCKRRKNGGVLVFSCKRTNTCWQIQHVLTCFVL